MKNSFIKLIFISFFLFLIIPQNVKADSGYTIENYDVEIKVNENNVLNVVETLDVNFISESHGIYREIPKRNTYYRDSIILTTSAKIDNINVNEEFTKSTEDGYLILKIGDSSKTVIGNKTYVIEYDYDVGDDNIDMYDDLYFNIIGTEWDTTIKNVTFKIEMPKEFDESLVNFTIGYYGSTNYEDVVYEIDGNTITGYVNQNSYGYALGVSESLTVRIELPEGYFTGERKVFDPTLLVVSVLIILLALLIIFGTIQFKKYSRRSY